MVQAHERLLLPDFLFPIVEGMHDTDRLLRAVGRESADTILQYDTVGAAVMNGSILPLVYATSAANAHGQLDTFANRVVFLALQKVANTYLYILTVRQNVVESQLLKILQIDLEYLERLKDSFQIHIFNYLHLFRNRTQMTSIEN